jgi:hypothetical protein
LLPHGFMNIPNNLQVPVMQWNAKPAVNNPIPKQIHNDKFICNTYIKPIIIFQRLRSLTIELVVIILMWTNDHSAKLYACMYLAIFFS